nr:acyl-CoA thioesterase [Maliibacterium massiliense]
MPEHLQGRYVSESTTEQIQILMPQDINGFDRLFGGKLVEWIDVVAAVVARRHCRCEVTTAAIDNLQFKAAAFVNDTLVLRGHMTYVGNTSMEVCVETYVESLYGARRLVNRAYLVMVALNERGQPTKVPPLILTTDKEREEYEAGRRRKALRKARQAEQY